MDPDPAHVVEQETPVTTAVSPEGPYTPLGSEPPVMTVRELMTSAEVADLLRVSQATLCRWRRTGTGPRVLWLSARVPRYRWRDVQQWMDRSRS